MSTYPIKALQDENGQVFVPITSTEGVIGTQGQNIEEELATKLVTSSIVAGSGITVTPNTTTHTVEISANAVSGNVIDNLTTSTSGAGSLDAHQGYVLNTNKVNITDIVDNCTTPTANVPLSANQGYVLFNKFSDYALSTAIPTQTSQLTNNSHFAVTNANNNFTSTQTLKGVDFELSTSGSSSNDSGDIVWRYGNGNEKARIWANDTLSTAPALLNYRAYDSSSTLLVNTQLMTTQCFTLDGTTLYIVTQ